MYFLLDIDTIKKLRKTRSAQFFASGEFLSAFRQMHVTLQQYAQSKTANPKEVEKRNAMLMAIANFANATEEMVNTFDQVMDDTLLTLGGSEGEHIKNMVFSLTEYAANEFSKAAEAKDMDRAKIALSAFNHASELITLINVLATTSQLIKIDQQIAITKHTTAA